MPTNSHNPGHVKVVPPEAGGPLENTLMELVDKSQTAPVEASGADVDARGSSHAQSKTRNALIFLSELSLYCDSL